MPKYIAFLKAINVLGHTAKMDHLKNLLEKKVETFIASGNVFFETKLKNQNSIEQTIEMKLEKELGYKVSTFIRTADELRGIEGN